MIVIVLVVISEARGTKQKQLLLQFFHDFGTLSEMSSRREENFEDDGRGFGQERRSLGVARVFGS